MNKRMIFTIIIILISAVSLTGCSIKNNTRKDIANTFPDVKSGETEKEIHEGIITEEGTFTPNDEGSIYQENTIENKFEALHMPPEPTRSPEKMKEIEEGKTVWKELYPSGIVVWFEINCHDGQEHIYYASKGMSLSTWTGSRYNVDKWQKDGKNLVDPTCTLRIDTGDANTLLSVIQEGRVFDTAFYTEGEIYCKTPESMTGETMLHYIENFDEGVSVENGNIIVYDVDLGLKVASRTEYKYDNGELKEIETTYFCEDSISDYYEGYLKDSGLYESVSRIGNNTYKCNYPEEYLKQYSEYSRATVRQLLVDKYNYEHSF